MSDKMIGLRILPTLTVLLLLCLGVAALSLLLANRGGDAGSQANTIGAQLLLLSQTLPLQARVASLGDPSVFDALSASLENVRSLKGRTGALPGGKESWDELENYSEVVLEGRGVVLAAHNAAAEAEAIVPELLAEAESMAQALSSVDRAALVGHLSRFDLRSNSLVQDLQQLAAGTGDHEATAGRLSSGIDFLRQVVRGLSARDSSLAMNEVSGEQALAHLKSLEGHFDRLSKPVTDVLSNADQLGNVHASVLGLQKLGNTLYDGVSLAVPTANTGTSNRVALWALIAGMALLLLIIAIYYWTGNIRRAAQAHAEQNEKNQEAILRLLDELSSLADGDLTVQATVTEDITGAIADSINFAIEALRDLVTTIKDSSIMVDAAAKQTEATTVHLAQASDAQSKQVTLATESVTHMARSVEEVSGNAERSADVARHSVDVAHKGGEAVRRTIDGMNTIRETIQDTSKRIKRLGESSQEIGNIVELINDIAEQTNILALNASIQASMAGEAGRGFAVVADEVQRLAERSANATKQIEVLVRTIQSDTNEAVVSMERSTTDVVGGALLAENAGAALDEIEQVSNQIATLVQNISGSSRQQATAAANISRNMGMLREISSQTADSTTATSNSISKLAELATQLRTSVAGFTLPDFTTRTAILAEPKPIPPRRMGRTKAS